MFNFNFLETGLGLVSQSHFVYNFSRMFLMLHSINWPNVIVWLPLFLEILGNTKKLLTLWSLFMDGVQLPPGLSQFEEAISFLPLSSLRFLLVLILMASKGWKAESTLEPPSGFKHGTPGLGIQHFNH